jgi:hypothetical protein
VAAIARDGDAARNVELVLPETGVCSTRFGDVDGTSCYASELNDVATNPVATHAALLPVIDLAPASAQLRTPVSAGPTVALRSSPAEQTPCCSTAEQSACREPSDHAACSGKTAAATLSGCGYR